MKITLGGIRGTTPVTAEGFHEFGGDTTCLLVEGSHGSRLIIDMGTGTRLINHRLRRIQGSGPVTVLMTHYHLDHLMGIPSFSPLYDAGWSLQFIGPRLDGFPVEDVMHRLLAKPFWPLQMSSMQATVAFAELGTPGCEQDFTCGTLRITWTLVHHPGGCVAYRIDDTATHSAMVFATDIEWGESTDAEKNAFLTLCSKPAPAQLLLFDGQFTPSTIAKYRSWGHSTWLDGVQIAGQAGIHSLAIIHHSPYRNDTELAATEAEIKARMPGAHLARQGHLFELTAKAN